ncbi:MAG: hypothetical protein Rhims3KO_35560 [Hyphomicrobiales bacterium]
MSIARLIVLSMGALVTLVVLVGLFSTFETRQLTRTFVEYRAVASSGLLASKMMEDLDIARTAALKYRFNPDDANVEVVVENLDKIVAIEKEMYEALQGFPEQEIIEQIPPLLSEYEAAMLKAVEFQKESEAHINEAESIGEKARDQLSEIMETALQDNDPLASSVAGLVLRDLLLSTLHFEHFLVTNQPEDAEKSRAKIADAQRAKAELLPELQNPRRQELAQSTLDELDNFATAISNAKAAVVSRNEQYATMDRLGPETLGLMHETVEILSKHQKEVGDEGIRIAKQSFFVVLAMVAVSAAAGSLLAFFSSRHITGNLSRTTRAMSAVANGDLEVELDTRQMKHEIGAMTKALQVFVDNARTAKKLDEEVKAKEQAERQREEAEREQEHQRQQELQRKEQSEREAERVHLQMIETFQQDMESVLGKAASGNFSDRMSIDIDDTNLVGLAKIVNQLLDVTERNIDDVVRSIGMLSEGDLGVRIDGVREGVFQRMQEDFNRSLAALAGAMAGIKENGQTVSATSIELQTAAKDMATRAESNAATVEETSAAVEQVTSSIRQVVQNAKSADEAARKVRESANRTRQVSDETEASINEMTEASEQINRVVKVIEDIAFQINLLALNAGVEAARAGEAGRGFSVVASEVRALAQRSQDAVQEISEVIDRNNRSVEIGVERVGMSRTALEDIVTDVEVASEQISAITVAVEQQSLAVEEVNTAITAIDRTTQTDAATLEEMTAASVVMSEEAKTLADSLGGFHGVETADPVEKESNVVDLQHPEPKPAAKAEPVAVNAAVTGSANDGWEDF